MFLNFILFAKLNKGHRFFLIQASRLDQKMFIHSLSLYFLSTDGALKNSAIILVTVNYCRIGRIDANKGMNVPSAVYVIVN